MMRRPSPTNNIAIPERASRKRTFTRRERAALFILREANALDLRIGTDGCDLILAPPKGMPSDSYSSFKSAILAHVDEIIAIILRENAR
jgi:hypothetical protein